MFLANKKKVDAIINYNNINENELVPVIDNIYKEYNYLPHEVLIYIAYKLNMSHSKIYEIASTLNKRD